MVRRTTHARGAHPLIIQKLAALFGAAGYLIVVFQWVVTAALFTPLLSMLPAPQHVTTAPAATTPPFLSDAANVAGWIFVGAVTIIMVVFTVVALIKLPGAIVNSSKKAVQAGSNKVTTALIKATHKKDTKKRRRIIQPRMVRLIKLMLLAAPLLLAYVSRFVPDAMLDGDMALFVVALFAQFALAAFIIQYAIIFLAKLDEKSMLS